MLPAMAPFSLVDAYVRVLSRPHLPEPCLRPVSAATSPQYTSSDACHGTRPAILSFVVLAEGHCHASSLESDSWPSALLFALLIASRSSSRFLFSPVPSPSSSEELSAPGGERVPRNCRKRGDFRSRVDDRGGATRGTETILLGAAWTLRFGAAAYDRSNRKRPSSNTAPRRWNLP